MRSGRPPIWNIAEGFGGDTWTGLVELSSKDRLQVPSSARRRVPWLSGGAEQLVLAEIQGNAVELLPWSKFGLPLIGKLQELASSLSADELQEVAIAAMDRYARLSIGTDGRTVLPTHLAHHLSASDTEVVRVVVRGGRVWLWSEASWKQDRELRYRGLDALLNSGEAPDQE